MRINNLAKPSRIGLNIPKITVFQYYTQLYNSDGQFPQKASAEIEIHTTRSTIPQPET